MGCDIMGVKMVQEIVMMHGLTRRAMAGGAALGALTLRAQAFAATDDTIVQAGQTPPYVKLDGHMPPLRFQMQLASTGKTVTEANFMGHPVILYFGFTRCPDSCPLTMQHAAQIELRLGAKGKELRVLFVTVDLAHDTIPRLKRFMAKFGPPPVFDALRGTPAALAALAHRYGVMYQAPSGADSADPVSGIGHSDATYLFGPDGKAIAILTSLPGANPGIGKDTALIRGL
jgi:protein SCO1/2